MAIGDSNTIGPMSKPGWVEYMGELFKEQDSHFNDKGNRRAAKIIYDYLADQKRVLIRN